MPKMKKAMDIEDLLIWAFRDQKVEQVAARLVPSGYQASPESSLAMVLALGCRVDTSSAGARHAAVQCHEDAAVLFDAVMHLPPEAWLLVIKHARSATQPDWYEEGPGRFVQPIDRNGQPKKLWRDPARQKGYLGIVPPELEGTHPDVVAEGRAAWSVWHAALSELVAMVNAEMVDHEAIGPMARSHPWGDVPIEDQANGAHLTPTGKNEAKQQR